MDEFDHIQHLAASRRRLRRRLATIDAELVASATQILGDRIEALELWISRFVSSADRDPPNRRSESRHDDSDETACVFDDIPRPDSAPPARPIIDEFRSMQITLLEAIEALPSRLRASPEPVTSGKPSHSGALSSASVDPTDDARPPSDDRKPRFDARPSWEPLIFGEALSLDASLDADRSSLLEDFLRAEPTAVTLVGRLLVFHVAPDGQKAQSLKDLGEAYYRWRPKRRGGEHGLETALASSLEKACEATGNRRKILLVQIGSRFNASLHRTSQKGSEIAEVFGWVVLREDGSVYQKAEVGLIPGRPGQ